MLVHIIEKPMRLVLIGFFMGIFIGFACLVAERHGEEKIRERMREICERSEIFTIGKAPEVYSCIRLQESAERR